MTNAVLLCNVLYDRAPQLEDFAEGLDAKILRDAAETILLLRRLQREDRLVSPYLPQECNHGQVS